MGAAADAAQPSPQVLAQAQPAPADLDEAMALAAQGVVKYEVPTPVEVATPDEVEYTPAPVAAPYEVDAAAQSDDTNSPPEASDTLPFADISLAPADDDQY